jgi:DNA-binding transcriptional regulator PaaX
MSPVAHPDFQPYGRGQLAKEILLMIAAGVIIPAAFVMPGAPIALRPLLKVLSKKCGAKRCEGFVKSLGYLKRDRLVSIAEKDGQHILTLSEDGKKRVLRFNLHQMTIKKPKRWDGYWRIVIFDIPERRKQGREALRSKLKELGFYQLQKSCFIYPFDCKSEIDFISEVLEVGPFVNLIVAKEIEGAPLLKKSFGLR